MILTFSSLQSLLQKSADGGSIYVSRTIGLIPGMDTRTSAKVVRSSLVSAAHI